MPACRLQAAMLGLALGGCWLAPAGAEEEGTLQPFQMVRSLQLVQDRIADGDHAALPMQKRLLEMIDKRLRQSQAEDFKDKRNFRSMLIYAMSGGNPVTLDVTRARLTLEPPDKAMVDGILSYLNGRPQQARTALAKVDPMTQPADLGAFLSLVKGSLEVNEQPAGAVALFDKARLLGAGTLVEEAALRRSIALATTLGDAKRFLHWSSQYVRRFLRSPYASQFADAFVSGVVTLHASVDFDAVAEVISWMEAEQRKVIYLRLARRAAIEGLADVAAFAARHVEEEAGTPADVADVVAEDPRAVLYASLSNVRSGNLDEVQAQLDGIDRARLSERDRQLLDAVRLIAGQVTAPVEAPPPEPEPKPVEAAVPASDEVKTAEEIARAEGPLPDVVPTDDLAPEAAAETPAAEEAAAKPAGQAEAATHASGDAGDAATAHAAEESEDVTAVMPIDETTTAAALTAKGARDKLDAVDQLLQENMDK